MGRYCHGECNTELFRPSQRTSMYDRGYKFCKMCNKFQLEKGLRCKCCKSQLRASPKVKNKLKL